jgi:hypothetical protein
VLLAVLLLSMLAGCASSPPASAPAPLELIGDIIGQAPLAYLDPTAANDTSWSRFVTYTSHNAVDDSPHHVTASIFVPKGAPPTDGFPIVALNRPVTGMGQGPILKESADSRAVVTHCDRNPEPTDG